MLHIVLLQPEIPHNTGAIGRLCLATSAKLHLIKPLGFSLDDKYLKRAGLDYWQEVDVHVWDNWEKMHASLSAMVRCYFIECHGEKTHWDANFALPEVCLIFGPETRGIPPSLIEPQQCLRIPMHGTRSLNLATAAAVVLYEAVRQRTGAGITS